jgi:hypothetical protein
MVPDEDAQITVQMLKSVPGPGRFDNVVALLAIFHSPGPQWAWLKCGNVPKASIIN